MERKRLAIDTLFTVPDEPNPRRRHRTIAVPAAPISSPALDRAADAYSGRQTTMIPPPLSSEDLPPVSGEYPTADTLDALAASFVPSFFDLHDQRSSPRVALEVELHIASDSHFFSGLSGDISEGGVFVSTYRSLPLGSAVDLDFSLPGCTRRLRARGHVRWVRDASPPGVGIAFEELDADDRAVIERFCSTRPPLYYDDVG
jgi:uncharacterized protein (TIGR02266 family)